MNFITPIILIIISIAAFFGYVDPTYRGVDPSGVKRSIQDLRLEDGEYQKALNDTQEIRAKRDSLQATSNNFDPDALLKLESLLPDNIDNIKLVMDMNHIADIHNLVLKNIKLDTAAKADPNKLGADNKPYGTVGLSFSVTASYDNFQNFLTDLEKSLRLVDVVDLSVSGNDTGFYEFSVGLRTYWLK
ncbi:MAG: type 4a pilus biogenesis protein PilO [Candidatus Paceibacterota bacterium]